MAQKIKLKNLSILQLLSVIILLLCSCIVYAQMPTELTIKPIDTTLISLPKQQSKSNQQIKKTITLTHGSAKQRLTA
jgi:hypothetical protein